MVSIAHHDAHHNGKGRLTKATLRQRVLTAGGWTMGGSIAGQALRFGSNLILTRLLFPEAFGLMAIVQAVLVGVALLSDVGLSASIVRSRRGADPVYLNTVWTIQIVKGLLVGVGMVVAALPVARAYGQPLLAQIVPVMGLVAVVHGFTSTNTDLARRNVDVRRLVFIDVGTQAFGIAVMIVLAWLDPTPWALVWGNVAGSAAKVASSHLLLPGPRNRLAWDRAAAKDVFSFGAWVLVSSAVTYLAGEGRQLLVASLLDVRLMGLFGLASTLNLVIWSAAQQIGARVLFPAYAEVWRDDPKRFPAVVERARRAQLAPCWAGAAALALVGPWVIELFYDPRYADAGLILQIHAAGLMVGALSGSYTGVLWAMGRARLATALLSLQVAVYFAGMLAGHRLGGPLGTVLGGSLTGWIIYPLNAWAFSRLGLWQPKTDVPVLLATLPVTAAMVWSADWAVGRAW